VECVWRLILDQDTSREDGSDQIGQASWARNAAKREQIMSIIVFTGPNGKPIAINSDGWQTVTEDIGGAKGARTQIGFSGATSAVHVRESYEEVIRRLQQAQVPQSS
jgi:hypothetical protein